MQAKLPVPVAVSALSVKYKGYVYVPRNNFWWTQELL